MGLILNMNDITLRLTAEARKNWRPELPNVRPKNASTLIIVEKKDDDENRVLMGRRHMNHKFMPGLYVFPGGRLDRSDYYVKSAAGFNEVTRNKVLFDMKGGPSNRRANALAMAAIRETYEEAGIFLGTKSTSVTASSHSDWAAFKQRNIVPDLSKIYFLARAITPPHRTRRFDTRFFVAFSDAIADQLPQGHGPTDELQDLHWLTIAQTQDLKLPAITKVILQHLDECLKKSPDLSHNTPAPYFRWRNDMMQGEFIE